MTLWAKLLTSVAQQLPTALLVVVESTAHSPGRQGFTMALSSDQVLAGTIGGGPMEYRLIAYARRLLEEKNQRVELLPQVHRRSDKHSSGMICRGEQLIALCPLYSKDLEALRILADNSPHGLRGSWELSASGLSVNLQQSAAQHRQFHRETKENWSYRENLSPEFYLFIIGAGHVGLAISRIAATLNFYTTVIDHRPHLSQLHDNCFAQQVIVAPYEALKRLVPEGHNVFAVVVTTNAKTDELALQQLINKNLGYLGVMGSSSKIEHLLSVLRKAGTDERNIARLKAPLGAAISSHTAEEIGVSIAAELISIRNSPQLSRGYEQEASRN